MINVEETEEFKAWEKKNFYFIKKMKKKMKEKKQYNANPSICVLMLQAIALYEKENKEGCPDEKLTEYMNKIIFGE